MSISLYICIGFIGFFIGPFAMAYGVAGNRYFPPTIVVEDPYAANTLPFLERLFAQS